MIIVRCDRCGFTEDMEASQKTVLPIVLEIRGGKILSRHDLCKSCVTVVQKQMDRVLLEEKTDPHV